MSFRRSDNTGSEKVNNINYKSNISFKPSTFNFPLLIQFYQISLYVLQQLRMAVPAEESEGETRGSILHNHFKSCSLLVLGCSEIQSRTTNNNQPVTIFIFQATFGIALHNSSRVLFEYSIAFLPRAVI